MVDRVLATDDVERRDEAARLLEVGDLDRQPQPLGRLDVVRQHQRRPVAARPEPAEAQLVLAGRGEQAERVEPDEADDAVVERPRWELREARPAHEHTPRREEPAAREEPLDLVVEPELAGAERGRLGAAEPALAHEVHVRLVEVERHAYGAVALVSERAHGLAGLELEAGELLAVAVESARPGHDAPAVGLQPRRRPFPGRAVEPGCVHRLEQASQRAGRRDGAGRRRLSHT